MDRTVKPTAPNTRPNRPTVLVFGATGQQGGAVASALSADGWCVRALVRNKDGDKAQSLVSMGVEIVQGDMADRNSIRHAMEGAYGVFSVQPSSGQGAAYGVSDDQEVAYGKAIADEAMRAKVQHLVYNSVNAAGPVATGMGHFDSKSEIEAHIRQLPIRSTIVRPSTFMELLMLPGMGLEEDQFTFFLRMNQPGQVIAVSDIGKIVAKIFAAPERNAARTIEIAGDTLTGVSLQNSLSRAAEARITYHRFSDSLLAQSPFLGRLAALFDDGRLAGRANVAALNQEFGTLLTFDAWLATQGRPLFESARNAKNSSIALR
ncbi:NmrA family protein [Pandoraea communis]|uniref:NmrA family protein n=1 Tax=Pandoraea communis TaxID=2508297 RepID=A0A5E4YFQ1_9BURK|nr:NmrA family protein [Pandoraea communis]